MRYIFLLLLLPTLCFAQTERELARQFNMSVMEIKIQKMNQSINELREFQKTLRAGKVGNQREMLITLTPQQKQQLRTIRGQKITAMKDLCTQFNNNMSSAIPTPTPAP